MSHPAFPSQFSPGMSLLDYFAAQAMAAIITGAMGREGNNDSQYDEKVVAENAYEMARAMMRYRSLKVGVHE